MKQPCVYMFANRRNGTIYTGVTSNPPRRAFEHREGLVKGFSSKYGCKLLVWYELHATMTRCDYAREADQGWQPGKEACSDREHQSGLDGFVRDADLTSSPGARHILRHCERSEAIQNLPPEAVLIASLRSQ